MRRRHLLFGALVAALAIAFACSGTGRLEPFCRDAQHMCFNTVSVFCCDNDSACGTGANGCPSGDCCLLSEEPDADKAR